MNTKPLFPPLKWAGGKRQIIDTILANLPSQWDRKCDRYYEPFLGGGAVLFALQPSFAIASDINGELVNFYNVVKNDLIAFQRHLGSRFFANNKISYYEARNYDRESDYEFLHDVFKAARFLYLNKHGFRGLCRYNASGQFNVPYGNYKSVDYDFDNIAAVSSYLSDLDNSIVIAQRKWQDSLIYAGKGDFVYLDPPYDPLSDTSNFVGYSNHGFSKDDHLALKDGCDRLSKEGAYIMQSNSATPFILDLYKEYNQLIIPVKRQINSKEKKRKPVDEVLIMNY